MSRYQIYIKSFKRLTGMSAVSSDEFREIKLNAKKVRFINSPIEYVAKDFLKFRIKYS